MSMWTDGMQGLRSIRSQPTVSAGFALILAIGIGVCTAVFNVADYVLYRPLPIHEPSSLVTVTFVNRSGAFQKPNISYPFLEFFRRNEPVFRSFAGFASVFTSLDASDISRERVLGQLVTGNYFPLLGVQPALGRLLMPEDETSLQSAVVISHRAWREFYGGAPDVIGKKLRLNGEVLTIVGVAPAGFNGISSVSRVEYWAPRSLELRLRAHTVYELIGRLKPEVSASQAVAQLNTLVMGIEENNFGQSLVGYERYGSWLPDLSVKLEPAALGSWGRQRGNRAGVLNVSSVFLGAVVLVYVIACTNAAALLSIRVMHRQRELAIRLALGASRWGIGRQLAVENAVLAMFASGLGVLLGYWILRIFYSLRGGILAVFYVDPAINWRVALVAIFLAVLAALFASLWPVWHLFRTDANEVLKRESSVATAHGSHRLGQNIFTAFQVAITMVLVGGTGICFKSMSKALAVDPGFNYEGLGLASVAVEPGPQSVARDRTLVAEALARVACLTGIQSASVCDLLVLNGNTAQTSLKRIEGYNPSADETLQVGITRVGPGFFRTLGVSVLAGREFDERDTAERPKMALVNEAFVARFFRGESPVGRTVDSFQIVGMVKDARIADLTKPPVPQLFLPIFQHGYSSLHFVVRTDGPMEPALQGIKGEILRTLKLRNLARLQALKQTVHESVAGRRMIVGAFLFLALVAVVLALMGLYTLVAFAVEKRAREIGIRRALGASSISIRLLVARQGLVTVGAGVLAGLVLVSAFGKLLKSVLYDTSTQDPLVYAVVTFAVACLGSLACMISSRHAIRVDPAITLKGE